jgi:hypothetical protein
MEAIMRSLLILAVAAGALLIGPRPSLAYEGPWCARQTVGADISVDNCSMRTFEQCRNEIIAGNRGFCVPNARYAGPPPTPVRKYKRHRRAYRQ